MHCLSLKRSAQHRLLAAVLSEHASCLSQGARFQRPSGHSSNSNWPTFHAHDRHVRASHSTMDSVLPLFLTIEYASHSSMSSNAISGTIPTEIGMLTSLYGDVCVLPRTLEALCITQPSPTLQTHGVALTRSPYVPALMRSSFYASSITGTIPTQIGRLSKLSNMLYVPPLAHGR